MSDNKRNGRSFNGTGYYIALILCAAAIGITGYLYYRNEHQVQQVSVEEPREEAPATVVMAEESVPREEPVPAAATEAETQAPATAPREPQVLRTVAPVAGTEAAAYSVEALCYNETTRDWRTHNGVDLAAEEGTPVVASAAGRVYTTYDDDSLGTTVVIRHDGGYTTRYSSLSEEITVQAGDTVDLGQTIGYVGTTALVEAAAGPHVHFSVSYRDMPMDPGEFLKLG